MTNEEALSTLRDFLGCLVPGRASGKLILEYRRFEAFRKAIEALEKQIPKKPPNHDGMVCPSCNSKARYGHPYEYYCPHCGQAIDWRMTNEKIKN